MTLFPETSTALSLRQIRVLLQLCAIVIFGGCLFALASSSHGQHIVQDVKSTLSTDFNPFSFQSPDGDSYQPIVGIQGVKVGKAFTGVNSTTHPDQARDTIVSELLTRFEDIGLNTDRPVCTPDLARYKSSGILDTRRGDTKSRITIAIDLHQSRDIMPSLSITLIKLVHLLLPNHEIYLSIFENDSSDGTRPGLGELAAALLALRIDGLWINASKLSRPGNVERITALADIRNLAMSPLLPYAADGVFLFLNDVVCCPNDILELLHQQRLQKAHVVASTDWESRDDDGGARARFRDIWVARGINGQLPYSTDRKDGFSVVSPDDNWVHDLWETQNETDYQRWLDGRAFPVYSGWNGAIAASADIFTKYQVRFRPSGRSGWSGGDSTGALGPWGRLLARPGYLESDCGSSECEIIFRDLWNLFDGQARVVLAPQSRTTYSLKDWRVVSKAVPITQRHGEVKGNDLQQELIDWSKVSVPSTVVCATNLDEEGHEVNVWGDENYRTEICEYMDAVRHVWASMLTVCSTNVLGRARNMKQPSEEVVGKQVVASMRVIRTYDLCCLRSAALYRTRKGTQGHDEAAGHEGCELLMIQRTRT